MDNHQSSKAWMLGPKAENREFLEKMLLEAIRDYCHWRRNFHPEDPPYVTAQEQQEVGFQTHQQVVSEALSELVARLKWGVPFFSPRYLGHMLTDQLLPAFVGYVAAMLHNQNTLVDELAPVTLQLEAEAMQWVGNMLGLDLKKAWGHLCSGGTTANMEALWVARNLRMLPYQIALTIAEHASPSHASMLNSLKVNNAEAFGEFMAKKRLHMLTIDEIVYLRDRLMEQCKSSPDLAEAVAAWSVERLGLAGMQQASREKLGPDALPRLKILLSKNAHYSVQKSASVLGIGENDLILIELDERMRLAVPELEHAVTKCFERSEAVLAVVGVYGSTEISALDDFAAIHSFRQRLRDQGVGDFWIHGDACYGGYAVAMLRSPDHRDVGSFLNSIDAPPAAKVRLAEVWDDQRVAEWQTLTEALANCDSISIDPHKLGYIPYPAGAIFFKDKRVNEFIRIDAPYLNAADPTPFDAGARRPPATGLHALASVPWFREKMSPYTLEGSRPGAAAAAVWLGHRTVPLDQSGHGLLVGQSILGTCHLQATLKEQLRANADGIGVSFLTEKPDLNIICYTFPSKLDGKDVPLAVINRAVKQLYNDFLPTPQHPMQTRDFVIAKTSLEHRKYGAKLNTIWSRLCPGDPDTVGEPADARAIGSKANPWRDDSEIVLVRTVVMGPFLLKTDRQRPFDLAIAYAEMLKHRLREIMTRILNSPLRTWRERLPFLSTPVLILEDNPLDQDALRRQIQDQSFSIKGGEIETRASWRTLAKQDRDELAERVIAGLIDIDLPPDPLGGVHALEVLLQKGQFKGAVVFTSHEEHKERVLALAKQRPRKKVTFRVKPQRDTERFQAAANCVMEDLWRILYT
jgi:glutamate/tyrosine decarboxylase-like PLP-dependent enzyme